MSFPDVFWHPSTCTSVRYTIAALDPEDIVEFAHFFLIVRMLMRGRGFHGSLPGLAVERI